MYDLKENGVILAKSWDGKLDLTNWWVSEKFDGVRAIWNGMNLLSRNNKIIQAPQWFIKSLPSKYPLDGELWIKRNFFNETSGIIRKKIPVDEEWKNVKFRVFDIPTLDKKILFEERIEMIKTLESNIVIPVSHTKIESNFHFMEIHNHFVKIMAEGTMIRAPQSPYEGKRSKYLLKHKNFQDTDAIVYGYQEGTGRLKGKLGSLLVYLKDNPQIKTKIGSGFTDQEREYYEQKYPEGTIISIKYNDKSLKGVPRFPVYAGIRFEQS